MFKSVFNYNYVIANQVSNSYYQLEPISESEIFLGNLDLKIFI